MVKSKRAREAADTVADSATVEVVNDSGATQDKKAKKRKRDADDEVEVNGAADSSEKKKSKKDKKDKKGKKHDQESRKEKKDKRKNIQDLPDEVMEDEDTPQEAEAETKGSTDDAEATRKEEKRARKQAKREKKEREAAEQGTASATSKSNDKPPSAATTTTSKTEKNAQVNGSDPIDLNDEEEATNEDGKKDRHIVFVGNLPFSATAASISAHFASLSPVAVRCLRNRDDPNPCRGIAFVEFGKVWHMRTCLDKFHHSTFDDGVSPARKINVELTAGGGGKTKQRQQKIKDKNKKLDENRAKRIEREKNPKQENGAGAAKGGSHQEDSIHPSRRARVPGAGF